MGREVDVPMEIPPGVDDVTAAVYDPDGKLESSTFQREPSDGLYHLRFIPKKAGQHKVRGVWDPMKTKQVKQVRWSGQPKYCLKKSIHVVISFAVVFGLLVLCFFS